jgi:hypothetical protein
MSFSNSASQRIRPKFSGLFPNSEMKKQAQWVHMACWRPPAKLWQNHG